MKIGHRRGMDVRSRVSSEDTRSSGSRVREDEV
jgi:hypothetical protein